METNIYVSLHHMILETMTQLMFILQILEDELDQNLKNCKYGKALDMEFELGKLQ